MMLGHLNSSLTKKNSSQPETSLLSKRWRGRNGARLQTEPVRNQEVLGTPYDLALRDAQQMVKISITSGSFLLWPKFRLRSAEKKPGQQNLLYAQNWLESAETKADVALLEGDANDICSALLEPEQTGIAKYTINTGEVSPIWQPLLSMPPLLLEVNRPFEEMNRVEITKASKSP
ncbi:hypothetical protein [Echinococcus multilocularis]|uniref:Uncharacterized protein n=1 Tax=Echinococcus multilocularis TaxID=6211 RepID=A0A0S4MKB9_ECHMU|nr:hypothetical protein [Echinococcus multilocularis]